MVFSGYFVDRPIFASVLSIIIFIVGFLALLKLPVSEYPEVSPPSIMVNAIFPGANPSVISETVAVPLEEQINGVENMLYMNSLASQGSLSITVTFAIGTDPDLAQQMVENRVSQALPRLPDITRQLGVSTIKSSSDLTMVVHIKSPNDQYDMLYLRNYATLSIKDQLSKIKGVGQVLIFGGGDYAMRIWLDPEKIAALNMTANDVISAIRRQNIQAAAGIIGGPPYDEGVMLELPINVQGRLTSVDEFKNIIIKQDASSGAIARLSDVARVEMGSQSYSLRSMLNNQQAIGVAIFAAPESNALQISKDVRKAMKTLKAGMPESLDYEIVYDPTVFVKYSIESVMHTLLEAVGLVVLVVIIFLQTWRASLIPLLAVPVSIIGTFAFMHLFGFSINVLSLFGLILAIGIVVDDAIVVVENVERNIENGKSPREATIQAMKEVTGPIIATTLVLFAVFIPIAFVSGLTGQFYKQFALTIAIATFISMFNSLTLSPALSATLLQNRGARKDMFMRLIDLLMGWFFRGFNYVFGWGQRLYAGGLAVFVRQKFIMMIIYAGLVVFTGFVFTLVPKGFVPMQDKQYLIAFAQLPPGSTLDQTEEVVRRMGDISMAQEGILAAVQFPGLSINGFINSPSAAIVFLPLTDFEERKTKDLYGAAIAGTLNQKFSEIEEAFIAVFPPPPVQGLGTVGGFKLQIQDKTDAGEKALADITKIIVEKANTDPMLSGVFSGYSIDFPQLYGQIDRTKAQQMGVSVDEIFNTMQVYLGSMYINDFNQFGRTFQVIAQGDKQFRARPQDIARLKTRSTSGDMVPLGAVMNITDSFGPETATRYNAYRSSDINGNAAPGFSSGQGQEAITKILRENLPPGMDFEWTDLTYQQILSGNTTIYIFPLCILLVFLVLAAQYESLSLPLVVIMIVPMAILSALVGIFLVGGDNNIFTQISLFVLAGLACKNAILIVEFARELEHQGRGIVQAALEASRLRLRPILMTSISFIMGVLPLVLSDGAGAEMRRAIGISVFSGMVGVTIFGLVFTPVFYVVVRKIAVAITGNKAAP